VTEKGQEEINIFRILMKKLTELIREKREREKN